MRYLAQNVYFVEGKCKAAFYDLNVGKLYHVSAEGKALVNQVLSGAANLSGQERKFVGQLEHCGLLVATPSGKHDISELRINTKVMFAWLEITTSCNLKCRHCYDEASFGKGASLSYEFYCHIIDELVANGIRNIQFIGGEPFMLGKEIFPYLDYAVGKFERIEIFTNGTLVRREWLSYFKKHHIRFALSVYSYQSFEHEKVTGVADSWVRTNQTIQWLHDAGISYRVCNVRMKNVELGEKATSLYRLHEKKDVVRLTGRANLGLLSKKLLAYRLITKETFSRPLDRQQMVRIVSGHNCFSTRVYIGVDGTVYPCVMERRKNYGNLNNQPLKVLLEHRLKALTKDRIKGCQDCEFRYACFDCRPDSAGRGLLDKPWYCTYEPSLGIWREAESFMDEVLGGEQFPSNR